MSVTTLKAYAKAIIGLNSLPRVGRPQLRFNRWHMGRHASLHPMALAPLLALACISCSDESSAPNGASEKQMSDEDGTQSSAAESMEQFQVQAPETIVFSEAESGDVRVLPETLICFAGFVSQPLRETLGLRYDIAFGGGIAAAFQNHMKVRGIPNARGAETLNRADGIGQFSDERQRRIYRERCAWTKDNIYVDVEAGLNALTAPYSIRAVVRQGDREWRRSIERLDREDWSETPPMLRDRTEFAIRADMDSIGVDVGELLGRLDYGS